MFSVFVVLQPFVSGMMVRMKQIAKPADKGVFEGDLTFDFGLTRVAHSDLDDFAKQRWFSKVSARRCDGEVKLDPRDDEVVVFKEFFEAGLQWPPHPLVVGALKKFNLRFHQLNPSSFVKLSVCI